MARSIQPGLGRLRYAARHTTKLVVTKQRRQKRPAASSPYFPFAFDSTPEVLVEWILSYLNQASAVSTDFRRSAFTVLNRDMKQLNFRMLPRCIDLDLMPASFIRDRMRDLQSSAARDPEALFCGRLLVHSTSMPTSRCVLGARLPSASAA